MPGLPLTPPLPPFSLAAIDAALVDLDGTLVDTLGDFGEALNRMLGDLELAPIGAAVVAEMVGKGSEHLIGGVLRHALAGDVAEAEARYSAAWASYQRHYPDVNGRYSAVYPGAREGLQALQAAGWPLACVTNKPTAFAVALLQAKQLDGFFSHMFGGDAFARKKPDPQPLREACRALGTAAARTLMVGDSVNDAQAARAAGCPVVLVDYGYNHGRPAAEAGADACFASLADLAALLPGAPMPAR